MSGSEAQHSRCREIGNPGGFQKKPAHQNLKRSIYVEKS